MANWHLSAPVARGPTSTGDSAGGERVGKAPTGARWLRRSTMTFDGLVSILLRASAARRIDPETGLGRA
jgi:hypothetical protein